MLWIKWSLRCTTIVQKTIIYAFWFHKNKIYITRVFIYFFYDLIPGFFKNRDFIDICKRKMLEIVFLILWSIYLRYEVITIAPRSYQLVLQLDGFGFLILAPEITQNRFFQILLALVVAKKMTIASSKNRHHNFIMQKNSIKYIIFS